MLISGCFFVSRNRLFSSGAKSPSLMQNIWNICNHLIKLCTEFVSLLQNENISKMKMESIDLSFIYINVAVENSN